MLGLQICDALEIVAEYYDLDFEDLVRLVEIKNQCFEKDTIGKACADCKLKTPDMDLDKKPTTGKHVDVKPPTCLAFVKAGERCKRNATCNEFCKTHFQMLSSNRLKFGHA